MSIGFSVSDFLTVPQFAWQVYKACRDSSSEYAELSCEVLSLHAVVKTSQELLQSVTLSAEQSANLIAIGNGCYSTLKYVEKQLSRYDSLGSQNKRLRHRFRWSVEKVADVRMRIISHTAMLAAFNSGLTKYVHCGTQLRSTCSLHTACSMRYSSLLQHISRSD